MDINLLNQQTPEQPTSTKKTKTVEQPQPVNQQVSLTVEDLAKTFLLLQQQNQDQINQQKYLEKVERENRTISLAGKASNNFKKKMIEEVKAGRFFAYPYVPALAEKFGNFFQIQISGYTLYFNKGLNTKVPLSLLNQVNMKFNQGSGLNSVHVPVVDDTGALDHSASRELSNQIEGILPNPKRPRY